MRVMDSLRGDPRAQPEGTGGPMKRITSIGVALAAAVVACLLGAGSAFAIPPTEQTIPASATPGVIDCGSFQDNYVDFYTATPWTTYYDTNGNPVRWVLHFDHHSNDVNSVTGLTIHEHGQYTVTIDLITGTATITGNQEVANRPGEGVVVQDVGRQVFDADGNLVFFAGGRMHSETLGGDQVLCDALS